MFYVLMFTIGFFAGFIIRKVIARLRRHGHFRLIDIPVLDKKYKALPAKSRG